MIANARMYSVSPGAAELWRRLLAAIIEKAGGDIALLEHPEPKPMAELWQRDDQGAVFMCGLPFSRAEPQPVLLAAPVPSPPEFGGEPRYWSDFVVRADSTIQTVPGAFRGRIALTVPDSQSGCIAALSHLMAAAVPHPLFREVIAPTITPVGALTAVANGSADIAPIDSYALRLLQRHRPELTAQVRIVGKTCYTPNPPIVATAPGSDAVRSAFLDAHRDSELRDVMDALLLQRFVRPEAAAYSMLRDRLAVTLRYWSMHRLADVIHPAFAL